MTDKQNITKMVPKEGDTLTSDEAVISSHDVADADGGSFFRVRITLDLMQVVLFVVAAILRFADIERPRNIVFDEILFGKFATLYLKNTFYFDLQPPLGKMLIAFAAHFSGLNDDGFVFDSIGKAYSAGVPVLAMRFIPAFCGCLLVPLVYQIMKDLKFHSVTASLAATLLIIDNAFHTQSRFMMLDCMLTLFSLLALSAFIQFRKLANRPFSGQWWAWLIFSGFMTGCAISVKYSGVFTGLLILGLALYDIWMVLPDITITTRSLWQRFIVSSACLILLPTVVYSMVFCVHLSVLTKSGPYDGQMSSHFQASLEGGLAAITKGQPQIVAHGSQITLRHAVGKACWLHSHDHMYPVEYPDGRKSSQQQQVTCYPFKDIFNWWIVKKPDIDTLAITDPLEPIKDGDVIQLIHGKSLRMLNSHNVAAPLHPLHQEVTCYVNYSVGVVPQNLWRLEIVNKKSEGDKWNIITSQIKLIHVNTSQALKTTGGILPEWGFGQYEVVTDTLHGQDSTLWNVEEHRYTKAGEEKNKENIVHTENLIPNQPVFMSLFSKFKELQMKMLFTTQDANLEHRYSTTPLDWPLGSKTLAYWAHPTDHAQIHLIANVITWCTGTIVGVLYVAVVILYTLLVTRKLISYRLPQAVLDRALCVGQVLVFGYLINYLPYFCTPRTLFLHHYLPCVPFKLMTLAATCELVYRIIRPALYQLGFQSLVVVWLSGAVYVFLTMRLLNQGTTSIQASDLMALTWWDSWDFVYH